MALVVQKYGGTSVGTPERILKVAQRIQKRAVTGDSLVVVVSAMGRTTDELLELSQKVSANPPYREVDMLLSVGERISMALLSMALSDLGIKAISLTGSQSGIITDRSHRRAQITRILGDRIRLGLAQKQVVIVAGFQGVSDEKEITTLGRGGSDTTAVALAAHLKADECEIYTDVDGVFSADPRVVAEAIFYPKVSYEFMIDYAASGAGVLHPRSVKLGQKFNVPIVVRNSLSDLSEPLERRTVINEGKMESLKLKGVTADEEKMLLRIELTRPTVAGSLWDGAAQLHLSVQGPVVDDCQVKFFIERDAQKDWKKFLQKSLEDGFLKDFQFKDDLCPISIVGNCFSGDGVPLQRAISCLARHHIHVTLATSTDQVITIAIPLNRVQEGLQALHKEFVEGTTK